MDNIKKFGIDIRVSKKQTGTRQDKQDDYCNVSVQLVHFHKSRSNSQKECK